ncbi:MAG TPA: DUF4157 domain-containing protein, partial [Gemmatimonadaceae bacterium]|nr:DUF4157 domain-containing protein [Gemmatimonadaceae bacterium]
MKAVALQSTDTGHTKGAQNGHISARPVSPWLIQPLSTFPRTTIQRKAGCACGGGCPSCKEELDVQPKLEISTPGDPLEQEADRVAGQVMRMPNAMRGSTGANQAPTIVHEVLRSPGDSLDSAARASMEPGFGRDFSAVRVHTDAKAAESARAVNALAYTVGHDIVFAEGQYSPQTQGGARLLAHELAHTVQHPESIDVLPFLEIGRIDDPAERAADLVADAVTRGEKASLAPARAEVPRLQRKCTASTTDRSDQRLVRCDDGEYRVTLTTAPASRVPDTRTSANAGWNNTDIFLNFEVCRGGTDVRIKPSVDLPRAIGQAIGNVVAGSGALTGATLSPGLEITIVQSDSFTLTLGPSVTVDRTGVTGGGLSATVQTPDITARGDVTYDAPSRTGFLTFTFSEGSPQRHVDCTRQGRERLV